MEAVRTCDCLRFAHEPGCPQRPERLLMTEQPAATLTGEAVEHITAIGYSAADMLYTARCSCGTDRRFLTWALTLGWRDSHPQQAR